MKQCLFQNHWGQNYRWVFVGAPETVGQREVAQTPEEAREQATQAAKKQAHQNLERGMMDIEGEMNIEKAIESGKRVQIEKSMYWHIKNVNKSYFTAEPKSKQYLKDARDFEVGIQEGAWKKLQNLWTSQGIEKFSDQPKDQALVRQEVMKIKKEIEESYIRFAGADRMIDQKEVKAFLKGIVLERRIRKLNVEKNLKMIENATEAQAKLTLEVMYYFKPEIWEKTIPLMAENMYSQAEKDSNEPAIIALANQFNRSSDQIFDFETAKDDLNQKLIERGKIGVQETLDFLSLIENSLQPGWIETVKKGGKPSNDLFEERIEKYGDASFAGKIEYLSGRAAPQTQEERMIITFMNASRQNRAMILRNKKGRDLLFRGIYITQTYRKEEYEGYFRSEGAKQSKRRRWNKRHLGGIILLGEEAKAIINNMDYTLEFERRNLKKEMSTIGSEVKGKVPRYKRQRKPKINRGVISPLEAQGFNARDLALGGAKVVAMAAFVINSLNTIHSADGKNLIERIGNGMKDIATLKNPTVALSLGAVFGTRTLQKNKYLFDYFSVGGYEQQSMLVNLKLHRMADRINHHAIKRFIHNPAEWRMMADLQKAGPQTIRNVLNKAQQRRRQNKRGVSLVGKEDLKPYISKKSYQYLTDTGMNTHVRYEFLRRFLQSKNSTDVRLLKQMCTGNGYINN